MKMLACAKDKSPWGPRHLLPQSPSRNHLQSPSPWSPGGWQIPEVKTPLPKSGKSEAGAGIPSPAVQQCHCGCRPGSAAGSRKNQVAPVQERNQSQNRRLSPFQGEGLQGSIVCYSCCVLPTTESIIPCPKWRRHTDY